MEVEMKKCDMCCKKTNTKEDTLVFGDWMYKSGITVHYFCLLLSTHLPQRGGDGAGILGFLMVDIRKEIRNAALRICVLCKENHASIVCHKCKCLFHYFCGQGNDCVFQFTGEFASYCDECAPIDKFQRKAKKNPPKDPLCYICLYPMTAYNPRTFIHANCCGNGYAHQHCMRKYALTAGYYLCCIWCRDKRFREHVRRLGVFVPDRDAQWEAEKINYVDLHRGHQKCNMAVCKCPRGRDYVSGKWSIILCELCGSYGAHNPDCIRGKQNKKTKVENFKCETCCCTEQEVLNNTIAQPPGIKRKPKDWLRVKKEMCTLSLSSDSQMALSHETPEFSDDETCSSRSAITVISKPFEIRPMPTTSDAICEQLSVAVNNSSASKPDQLMIAEPINNNVEAIQSNELAQVEPTDISSVAATVTTTVVEASEDLSVCENSPNAEANSNSDDDADATSSDDVAATTVIEVSQDLSICENSLNAEAATTCLPQTNVTNILNSNSDATVRDDDDAVATSSDDDDDADSNSSIDTDDCDIVILQDWPEFDASGKVNGTCKVRIDFSLPRFAGVKLEDIYRNWDLIKEEDKFERTSYVGVYSKLEEIIESYKPKQ